jgi:hypothetical protein
LEALVDTACFANSTTKYRGFNGMLTGPGLVPVLNSIFVPLDVSKSGARAINVNTSVLTAPSADTALVAFAWFCDVPYSPMYNSASLTAGIPK